MFTEKNSQTETPTRASNRRTLYALLLGMLFALLFGSYLLFKFVSASPTFPQDGATLQIKRGMPVQEIAFEAKKAGIVKSSLLLYAILTYTYDPTRIFAGTYRFESPHTVFEVARKLARNDVDKTLKSITIPEGVTRKDIAKIASSKLQQFDTNAFLELTKNNEGYLFPETYFVPEDFSAEEFVTLLTETFSNQLIDYKDSIEASDLSEYEVIILASILEREANDEESMKMVSGILQNRLSIGMALQTDASIEYVLDKPLSELSAEDLDLDTPYNTYMYPGLVPTPIGNPGLLAIDAVLNPTPSDFFYYITGNDGNFYYAETFEEHKQNIYKYLQ
jgi:UPF0755 protein